MGWEIHLCGPCIAADLIACRFLVFLCVSVSLRLCGECRSFYFEKPIEGRARNVILFLGDGMIRGVMEQNVIYHVWRKL